MCMMTVFLAKLRCSINYLRKAVTVTFLVKMPWVLGLVFIMASVNMPNVPADMTTRSVWLNTGARLVQTNQCTVTSRTGLAELILPNSR